MKVKFGIYETPQPEGTDHEILQHARIHTRGTVRLNELCIELREQGVNSAQVKAVLDAAARFLFKSLQMGYNVELEEIGTFSLSLRSKPIAAEPENNKMRVEVDTVNFRCNQRLRERVRKIELIKEKDIKRTASNLSVRKKRMIGYLEKYGYINTVEYAELNDCTRYQSRKDLLAFTEEGLLIHSGRGSHKVYLKNPNVLSEV